jgi:nucleotide-binding universal stress UspA family protein
MKVRKTLGSILFATDLTENSAHAASWLRWFSNHYGSKAYIVYVLNFIPFGISAEQIANERNAAAGKFDRFIRKHRLNQKAFTPMLLVGDTSVALEEFIDKQKITLVILGSRAIGLNRLLKGSVSEELIRSLDCPVLTVGPHAKPPRSSIGIRRAIFATNLAKKSGLALTNLEFLFKVSPRCGLTLAHFLPNESNSVVKRDSVRREFQAKLMGLVPDNLRRRIERVIVEASSPVKGILELVKGVNADLVILAVRDAGEFTRAATHSPGSITPQIIQSASCPVLTLRV